MTGAPGELVLALYGRDGAEVTYDGEEQAVATVLAGSSASERPRAGASDGDAGDVDGGEGLALGHAGGGRRRSDRGSPSTSIISGTSLGAHVVGPGAAGAEPAAARRRHREGISPPRCRRSSGRIDGSGTGMAPSSAAVYGCAGRAYSTSGSPTSHSRPRYMTADPVADVLHHGQVVGDEHHRQAVAGLHVLEQVQDLRLDRHVEGGHRLVADDQLRAR